MFYALKQELIRLDDITRHSQNVSQLVGIITQGMAISGVDKRIIKCAAAYHDIGKGFVNQDVLYKPGVLTARPSWRPSSDTPAAPPR